MSKWVFFLSIKNITQEASMGVCLHTPVGHLQQLEEWQICRWLKRRTEP